MTNYGGLIATAVVLLGLCGCDQNQDQSLAARPQPNPPSTSEANNSEVSTNSSRVMPEDQPTHIAVKRSFDWSISSPAPRNFQVPAKAVGEVKALRDGFIVFTYEGSFVATKVENTDYAERVLSNQRQRLRREAENRRAEEQRIHEAKEREARQAEATPVPQYTPSSRVNSSSAESASLSLISNGYAWNRASESAKQKVCRQLALISRHKNSANFFYDALQAFYNTSDSYTLKTSIRDIGQLSDAASTALPESERQY